MEAIRIAEEREANVKAIFTRFDTDKSGTIDMEELLVLLDDLGLLTKLKTEPQEFAQDMFVKYDANGDGVLSFEEFKGLYNAAIDDSAGKRKKDAKPVQGRDSKALDGGTLEARKKIAQEKAAKKAEEAERIRKQNAEMKVRAHPGSFAPQAMPLNSAPPAAWPRGRVAAPQLAHRTLSSLPSLSHAARRFSTRPFGLFFSLAPPLAPPLAPSPPTGAHPGAGQG